ncbi:ribonuclease pancreatic-like [Gracilinanus agilis]|uniref:ribonuclease pancreatic-like n=1 Tax=Gracilinanus agilis TaxID=191870 RepID=UPI001CFC5F81|nr:ribonuclease pancreatic-like [Gracilinanus agilis]
MEESEAAHNIFPCISFSSSQRASSQSQPLTEKRSQRVQHLMMSPFGNWFSTCLNKSLPLETQHTLLGREQMFWREHHNEGSSSQDIQRQMRQINWDKGRCKPVNTILHGPREEIRDICTNPNSINVPCKNGQDNCFEGPNPYSVTVCREKGNSRPPDCRYNCNKEEQVKVTVACEKKQPVHLEGIHRVIQ